MTSVAKETTAIVKTVRKWSHLLLGCHFKQVSDRRSASFMFNISNFGKINNAKVMRWRLELIQIGMKLRQVNFAVQIWGEDQKELKSNVKLTVETWRKKQVKEKEKRAIYRVHWKCAKLNQDQMYMNPWCEMKSGKCCV